jgi:aspartate/methionine/tyrosine aminotransferase
MASMFLTRLLVRTPLARLLPRVRRLPANAARYLHYYSDRVLTAPLDLLGGAAHFLEMPAPDGIDLAQASPRFDLVPSATTWLPAERRGLPAPGGLAELRDAVARHLAAEQALTVRGQEEVVITAGAAGAFAAAVDALVNPGDHVALFDPTALLYPLMLRQRGADIRWIATELDQGQIRFRFDHLARALHRARLLVLACPDNPTGGVFNNEDLEQIAWWADRHDVLLFCDRSYARFQYEGEPCGLATLPQGQKRTLTAGSLSKGHGLAWARVGWLAGPPPLVGACRLTATLQGQLVPTVCQQLACSALAQDQQAFAVFKADLAERRRYVFDRLLALGLQPSWPAGAFFFWVGVGRLGLEGEAFADRLLREKKVLAWPGFYFGPAGRRHIRLSYLADEGRLREGLARVGDLVRELGGKPAARQAA